MPKKRSFQYLILVLLLTAGSISSVYSQKIGIFNEKQKKIYTIKPGRNIDFRIDYDKLYPEKKDSIVETRVYALIDSIRGDKLFLVENIIVINYTKDKDILVEAEYEYTDLVVDIKDIKAMSFSPTMAAIGNALLMVGIATIIVSPILGITPDGYSTQRFATVATIGAGTAVIGGAFSLTFGQKPVKFKDFEGPEYFKKYQPGSLSTIQ